MLFLKVLNVSLKRQGSEIDIYNILKLITLTQEACMLPEDKAKVRNSSTVSSKQWHSILCIKQKTKAGVPSRIKDVLAPDSVVTTTVHLVLFRPVAFYIVGILIAAQNAINYLRIFAVSWSVFRRFTQDRLTALEPLLVQLENKWHF